MEISPFLWGEFQTSSDGLQHDQQLPEPHGLTLGGDQHLLGIVRLPPPVALEPPQAEERQESGDTDDHP